MAFLHGNSRRHDPGGPATYRHLLSPQAMTVFNPLRVIAHCDIDAAYAQFEQVRLGLPDSVPLICAQWQSIIAVNYPARKFGIKRFNTIDEAKKMCPELIVQHVATYRNGEAEAGYWGEVDPRTHKVSLDPYRRESLKILAIFKEMVPRGEIEKASIDEAFLDLSLLVIERMLERFPYLATVPPDAPDGLDSALPSPPPVDWTKAGMVFPVHGEGSEPGQEVEEEVKEEERSEDGQSDDGRGGSKRSGEEDTWEDWALCIGAEIMAETRNAVWTKLHYTCSAGIAHNKPMAKLCSAWKKPNNQTVMRTAAIPAFLRDMDFTDIRFLGGKLGNAMATEYGAKTVGDMLLVPLEEMQKRFGEESIWVYNILRGIDHTEVTPRVATKSMLASKNVRPNVTTPEQGLHWLNVLAGELNVRLRDAREIAPGLWPKTLVLSHRTGIDPSRSRQIPFPFTRSLSTEYIVKYAKKLWEEATQPMAKGNMKLNNIALSFTGLERLEEGQKGIESFFGAKPVASSAVDNSTATLKRVRSGSPIPIPTPGTPSTPMSSTSTSLGPSPKKPRLPTLHTGKRKTGLQAFLAANANASTKNGESSRAGSGSSTPTPTADIIDTVKTEIVNLVDLGADEDGDAPGRQSTLDQADPAEVAEKEGSSGASWTCPRCQTTFSAPDDLEPDSASAYVTAQRQEHDDYHFAMDLQEGDDRPGSTSGRPNAVGGTSAANVRPKVKKKKKAEGIKAFFTPKSK